LYREWCSFGPKTAKSAVFIIVFGCKKCIFGYFLMKNEAKTLFFECFLGVKLAFLGVFSAKSVPETA
jgi:hypothetical protein